MKILHSSDWHLGAYVGPQCDDPYKRMENTIKCLDVLEETARQEQPDIILVSGDVFHNSRIWNDRAMAEVRTAIDYLETLGKIAPVMVLFGTPNHDASSNFSMMEDYFSGRKYPYVRFFTKPEIIKTDCKSGPIQIAGMSGFDKGHFRTQFPGLSAEQENQVFTQQLSQIVQGLSAQLDPTIPSVLMAHHTVVGCELDNGTHVFQANEVVLDAAALDNGNFDLVCLGHIHKAQRVDACSKPVYYAGSIDAFTFNDEGTEKGFWIHNLEDYGTSESNGALCMHSGKFIETPAREFITEKPDQTDMKRVVCGTASLQPYPDDIYKNKIVRILYTCDSETEKALDKKKLERDLYAAGAYYVSEIRPENITTSVNRERMTEKLTVSDCLERYLKEKGKTESEISQLMFEAVDIVAEASASSPVGTTSGLFLPVEIEVRNYRSYAEEKLSFEDIFFAMVNGKNGSGKSSLFMDAITDCLYEETREGELTGWIRNGEKSGSVSFTFKLGDDLWRVTRTRQRSGKGTLALATWYDNEKPGELNFVSWKDHSCELMKDTQQAIIDLLGMDCDTFQSCVLIMQDQYGKFMEASKEDRMAVLANLLGLGIYDELEKLAKDSLTDVNREIKNIKTDMSSLENETKTEENLCAEKSGVEIAIAAASDNLRIARNDLAGYQARMVAVEGYAREASELEKDLKVKTDSYTEKKSKKADMQGRVTETESFLKNEQNIIEKCAELDSTRLEIAAMDGKVQLLNEKKLQCSKLNRELLNANALRKNISVKLDFIKTNLKDRERLERLVVGSTVEQDIEECEQKAKAKSDANIEAQNLQMKKNTVEATYRSDIRDIESRLEYLNKKAAMLKDINCADTEKASCRFLKDAIEAKSEVNTLELTLTSKKVSAEKDIESAIKAVEDTIKKREGIRYDKFRHDNLLQEVKTFRDAKDRLAKIAADAATADAINKQDAELVEKINEYDKDLQAVSGEIAILENETSRNFELKSRVNSLLQYENMKMQLPRAKQFVESTVETIKQLSVDIDELQRAINLKNERLLDLYNLTAGRDEIKIQIASTEGQARIFEALISELNQKIGTINAKLSMIAGQKLQLQEKQTVLQQSAKQSALLTVLADAFSQDGIPYQIIRDIVPELEAAANEILGQMTGGRMRLEFVTVKVLKSNKAKEIATLEIIIIDVDNGILPYLSRSGGQKVRAALAVNFALANIKASRVGLQLGMMFVDEPPFLDSDGVEAYCAALETIHGKYPEMKLLAISHDENMKTMFPQQLYVDVTENGSRVRRL